MSYNEVRSIAPCANLVPRETDGSPSVSSSHPIKEIYFAKNKVAAIEGLEGLVNVEILELGHNRIRKLENLDHFIKLRELWLGRNRIEVIEGLAGLIALERLSLQANRLTNMMGVATLSDTIQELYLSANGITKIEGLERLHRLRVLDLADNKLQDITGLDHLTGLEDLWLNNNTITQPLDDIALQLAGSKEKLVTLYLENNPCTQEEGYVPRMFALCPNLLPLDSSHYK